MLGPKKISGPQKLWVPNNFGTKILLGLIGKDGVGRVWFGWSGQYRYGSKIKIRWELFLLPSSAKLQLQLAEFELYSQLFLATKPATHPADWESLA